MTVPVEPQACGDKRGTPAGHARHVKAGQRACDSCREAHNTRVKGHARTKRYQRARQRAFVRLSHIYDDEYQALLAEELAKEATK